MLNVKAGSAILIGLRLVSDKGGSFWSAALALEAFEHVLDPDSASHKLCSFVSHQRQGALASLVDARHAPEVDNKLAFRPSLAGLFPMGTKVRCPGLGQPSFQMSLCSAGVSILVIFSILPSLHIPLEGHVGNLLLLILGHWPYGPRSQALQVRVLPLMPGLLNLIGEPRQLIVALRGCKQRTDRLCGRGKSIAGCLLSRG